MVDSCHSPPCSPAYTCPSFTMPTSKMSIVQRDEQIRSQLSRELTLATLKDPSAWDACWRPLLLVHVLLSRVQLPSLQGHSYIYERWWSHDDNLGANGVELKLLLTNTDGTSMVLLGTSVWKTEEESSSARWVCISSVDALLTFKNEVSLQLQRFFCHRVNLYEEIKMKSVVVSCWDSEVRDAFFQAVMDLERSWRCGTAFIYN